MAKKNADKFHFEVCTCPDAEDGVVMEVAPHGYLQMLEGDQSIGPSQFIRLKKRMTVRKDIDDGIRSLRISSGVRVSTELRDKIVDHIFGLIPGASTPSAALTLDPVSEPATV